MNQQPSEVTNGKGRTLEDVFDLVDRLQSAIRLIGVVAFVSLLATSALVWQVLERNKDLDNVESDVKVIRQVAEEVNQSPDPNGPVQIGLKRIGEILTLMCEEPQHQDSEVCAGG